MLESRSLPTATNLTYMIYISESIKLSVGIYGDQLALPDLFQNETHCLYYIAVGWIC